MKRIRYQAGFLAADGQPFTILDPGVAVQRKAREDAMVLWDKKAAEALRKGLPEPKEASWVAPTIDCDFAQAMIWFMNNIPFSDERDAEGKPKPPRKLKLEDAGRAYEVIKAFKDIEAGYVELDAEAHKWLLEIVDLDGLEAFRPLATQAIVKERLEDVIKDDKKGK